MKINVHSTWSLVIRNMILKATSHPIHGHMRVPSRKYKGYYGGYFVLQALSAILYGRPSVSKNYNYVQHEILPKIKDFMLEVGSW